MSAPEHLTPTEKQRYEAAKAATSGPWETLTPGSLVVTVHDGRSSITYVETGWEDAAHIAANDPQTVISDLDLIEAYREAWAAAANYIGNASANQADFQRDKAARALVAELEAGRA